MSMKCNFSVRLPTICHRLPTICHRIRIFTSEAEAAFDHILACLPVFEVLETARSKF